MAVDPYKIGIKIKRKGLTKTFIIISNWKHALVSMVYAKICKGLALRWPWSRVCIGAPTSSPSVFRVPPAFCGDGWRRLEKPAMWRRSKAPRQESTEDWGMGVADPEADAGTDMTYKRTQQLKSHTMAPAPEQCWDNFAEVDPAWLGRLGHCVTCRQIENRQGRSRWPFSG